MSMMKRIILLLTVLMAIDACAQQLPQFAYNNYEGWTYNNPGLELNTDNISQARIRLYVDSQGLVVTLTSPDFACQGLDSIRADVKWRSSSPTVALTMALDDYLGTPLDSASCLPSSASHDQDLSFTLPIPAGLDTARVRFVSWNAIASTSGAIRRITITGIAAAPHDTPTGDVDGDGHVNIADVTVLINLLLNSNTGPQAASADVNHDTKINIDDVTTLINILLNI